MANLEEVLVGYKKYIEIKATEHFKRFCAREKDNLDSCIAEAVYFNLLRTGRYDISIAEDVSKGGADYLCKVGDREFLAEVTTLDSDAVERRSGWKNEIPITGEVFAFDTISVNLCRKAIKKVPQLSGISMPRLLVIGSRHVGASALMGCLPAELLLTGDQKIGIDLSSCKSVNVTDLENSVFFHKEREEGEDLLIDRQCISAILLMGIHESSCTCVGLLHPQPLYEFSPSLLPKIPFARLKKWPPAKEAFEIEWIISHPDSYSWYYQSIELTDKELKNL
jgi:hypothetical protein